jgi:integrase
MPLTQALAVKTTAREKTYRLFDSLGLYLEIAPSGGKWWRIKYHFQRREKRLSLGVFPAVSLQTARLRCIELRAQIAAGIDPSALRKASKEHRNAVNETFEAIAREWHANFSRSWADSHGDRNLRRLESYAFPWLGTVPIRKVTAVDLLSCIRRLEHQNTHETARRVLQICGQVFRYAIMTGRAETDVALPLRGALAGRNRKHLASIRSPREFGALLREIDVYDGTLVSKCALRLAPLVFVRPGELRNAQWSEIDFLQAEWHIPAHRMKARLPHIVPLSSQALSLLQDLKPLTGRGTYVFPSERTPTRPMSNNTLNAALRRLGYGRDDMTAHGFRSTASTLLNELGWTADAIERQLAHGDRNGIRSVYNYAQYLPERRLMMQAWADYLDHLRGEVRTDPDAYPPKPSQSEHGPSWLGPNRVLLGLSHLSLDKRAPPLTNPSQERMMGYSILHTSISGPTSSKAP